MLQLYEIADGKRAPGPQDPTVVICMDEFGPLNGGPVVAVEGAAEQPVPVSGGVRVVAQDLLGFGGGGWVRHPPQHVFH